MRKVEVIFDDFDRARRFVASLDPKLRRRRFSASAKWAPDHVALVLWANRGVALADCVVSENREAANVSLLAAPRFGAAAVRALLALKRHVGCSQWEATLRSPNASTIAISRRFCDVTYDQAAWEMAGGLAEVYGPQHYFRPAPLFPSNSFLLRNGLPKLKDWEPSDVEMLLSVCADPNLGYIRIHSGHLMHSTDMMSVAFDLLKVPIAVRQSVSRTMLAGFMAMRGHDPAPLVARHIDGADMSKFFTMLQPYRGRAIGQSPLFSVEKTGGTSADL